MLQRPEDLWAIHSQPVFPRPHKKENPSWIAIQKVPIHSCISLPLYAFVQNICLNICNLN